VAPIEEDEDGDLSGSGYDDTDCGRYGNGTDEGSHSMGAAADEHSETLRLALEEKSDECISLSRQLSALKELVRAAEGEDHGPEVIGRTTEGHSESASSLAQELWGEHGANFEPPGILEEASPHQSIRSLVRALATASQRSSRSAPTNTELAAAGDNDARPSNPEYRERATSSAEASAREEAFSGLAKAEATVEALRCQVRKLEGSVADLSQEKARLSGSIADRQRQWDLSMAAKEHEIGQLKEIISQVCAPSAPRLKRDLPSTSQLNILFECAYTFCVISCKLRKSKSVNAQTVDATSKERDELRLRGQSLSALIDGLRSENDELRAALRSTEAGGRAQAVLEVELEALRRSSRQEVAELQREHENLRGQLAGSEMRHQGAQQRAFEAARHVETLKCDLAVAQADQARASTSSSNLQRVLEQFQAEKALELSTLAARSEKEVEAAEACHAVQLNSLRQALAVELGVKEAEIDACRLEVAHLERKLGGMADEKHVEVRQMRRTLDQAIEQLTAKNEDVVDRRLVASIVVQYFAKKRSVEV
jgi:hypothetical protein